MKSPNQRKIGENDDQSWEENDKKCMNYWTKMDINKEWGRRKWP